MSAHWTWWALGGGAALLGLLGALALGLRWMMDRPLFVPGTVRERVGQLEPVALHSDRFQVTPDIALYRDSFGAGETHAIYVHGGPGLPPAGRPRGLVQLGQSMQVHLVHQRGCGASTRPFVEAPEGSFYSQLVAVEARLGLAEQLADLERVRRLLGQEQIVLVGHSFGALVAALYAAEFPEHVRALVLISPAPLHVMPIDGPDLFAQIRERLPAAERAPFDSYMASYFDFRAAMQLDEPALSRHYSLFIDYYARATGLPAHPEPGAAGGFAILATYASLGRRHDWTAALSRIRAPTVVLHGAADTVPEVQIRAFAAAIPGAEVEVVPGVGHFLVEDEPEVLVRAVERALSSPAPR
jgi:proline iminopeptidase